MVLKSINDVVKIGARAEVLSKKNNEKTQVIPGTNRKCLNIMPPIHSMLIPLY